LLNQKVCWAFLYNYSLEKFSKCDPALFNCMIDAVEMAPRQLHRLGVL